MSKKAKKQKKIDQEPTIKRDGRWLFDRRDGSYIRLTDEQLDYEDATAYLRSKGT